MIEEILLGILIFIFGIVVGRISQEKLLDTLYEIISYDQEMIDKLLDITDEKDEKEYEDFMSETEEL